MRLIKIIFPNFHESVYDFRPYVWTQDAIEWTTLPKYQPVLSHIVYLFVVIVIGLRSYILVVKY